MSDQPCDRIATVKDIEHLKMALLRELNKLISRQHSLPRRSWMKSSEVRRYLKISGGTLQHLRDSGKLKYSKVGSIFFYDVNDVEALVEGSDSQ